MFGCVFAGVTVTNFFFGKDAVDELLTIGGNTRRDAGYLNSVYADAVYHLITISNECKSPIAPSAENFAFLMIFSNGSIMKLYDVDRSALARFVLPKMASEKSQLVKTAPARSVSLKKTRFSEQSLNSVFFSGSLINEAWSSLHSSKRTSIIAAFAALISTPRSFDDLKCTPRKFVARTVALLKSQEMNSHSMNTDSSSFTP